jgi:serine/threonine protein kinase
MSFVNPQVRDLFSTGALAGRFEPREGLVGDHLGQRRVAWQREPGREVVLRLMSVELVPSWREELGPLLELEHGKLVGTIAWGDDDGVPWIVSERHRGPRLDSLLADGAGLPLEEVVPLISQVLMPVGHAHERGLVVGPILARDVVVGERGGRALSIKLADFGLARLLAKRPFSLPPAPEVARGGAPSEASDVFELGLLLHHLLAGTPMSGDAVGSVGTELAVARPDLPRPLLVLLDAMLSDAPEVRPSDANAVVERLIDAVPKSLFKLPSIRGRVDDVTAAGSTIAGRTAAIVEPPRAEPPSNPMTTPTTSPRISIEAPLVVSDRGWRRPVGIAVAVVAVGIAGWLALPSSSKDESVGAVAAAATVPTTNDATPPVAAPPTPPGQPVPSVPRGADETPRAATPPEPVARTQTDAAPIDAPAEVDEPEALDAAGPRSKSKKPRSKSAAATPTAPVAPPPTAAPASPPSSPAQPPKKAASSALLTDDTPTKPRSSELLLDK